MRWLGNFATKRNNDNVTLANDFAAFGDAAEADQSDGESDCSEVLAGASHALNLPLPQSRNE